MSVRIEAVYALSDKIVVREIDGEVLILPLVSGVGSLEDEFYSLNGTGREIWRRLDGKHSLAEIARELAQQFDAPEAAIEQDVCELATELYRRGMLVEVG